MDTEAGREAMRDAALAVLLWRAGGIARYTEQDYDEIAGYFGGSERLNVHLRIFQPPGLPPIVELALEEKKPARVGTAQPKRVSATG